MKFIRKKIRDLKWGVLMEAWFRVGRLKSQYSDTQYLEGYNEGIRVAQNELTAMRIELRKEEL